MKASLLFLSALLPSVALFVCACRAAEANNVRVTLTRGEQRVPVADEDVALMFENPPGGTLPLRTDAHGRVEVPARFKNLRVVVGTDCEGNTCRRTSRPQRLEGDDITLDTGGGLNYP